MLTIDQRECAVMLNLPTSAEQWGRNDVGLRT
jgi:hypothetical protein